MLLGGGVKALEKASLFEILPKMINYIVEKITKKQQAERNPERDESTFMLWQKKF